MPINHKKKGCHKNINDSKILIKDKGSRSTLIILNPTQENYLETRLDGCYLDYQDGQKSADYMLSKQDGNSLLIELKGRNVEHGCKQVLETYRRLKQKSVFKNNAVPAIIVLSNSAPKARPGLAKYKDQYKRLSSKQLHTKNHPAESTFDSYF